jgi:hypothetical protein
MNFLLVLKTIKPYLPSYKSEKKFIPGGMPPTDLSQSINFLKDFFAYLEKKWKKY